MSTINKDFRVKHGLIVEANTHINQNLQVDGTINGLNVNAQAAYTQAAFDQANTSGNPFNQDLNTANNVTFNQIIVSSNTTSNSYKFNTSAGVSVAQGEMAWNSSDGTVDIGVGYADVVLQVGQETHYVVRNNTGSQILDGTALYCSGVTTGSGRLEVSPMIGNGSIDPVQFIGLATHNINNGVNGIATYFGYVRGIDTRGTANTALSVGDEDWQVGDKLYVHPTANGKLTKVEPQAPNTKICTAVVITRHQTVGVLFVRPTTNLVLSKLSDAQINTVSDGELLQYVSANNRWENKSSSSIIEPAFTQANSAITLAQAAFDQANTGGGVSGNIVVDSLTSNTYLSIPYAIITTSRSFANTANSNTLVDNFSTSIFRGAKYNIQITSDSGYQISELSVLQFDTDVMISEYGVVCSNTLVSSLGTFYANVQSGVVNLNFNGIGANNILVVYKVGMANTGSAKGVVLPEDLMTGSETIDLSTGSSIIDLNEGGPTIPFDLLTGSGTIDLSSTSGTIDLN